MDWLRCALPSPDPAQAKNLSRTFIREQIQQGLMFALTKPTFASPRLAKWFRQNRKLGSRDRKIAAAAIYGIIRHQGFLQRAGYSTPNDWLQGWERLHTGDRFEHLQADAPLDDFATALSLPKSFAQEWQTKLSPEACLQFAQTLNQRAPMYLHSNPNFASRQELRERLLAAGFQTETCQHSRFALRLMGTGNLLGSPLYQQGAFEIQDLSSQRLCTSLHITPQTTVWDMCAGAGGKSLALAMLGAKVYASDIRQKALHTLVKRARRMKLHITVGEPEKVDIILLDAPCSGSGRLRREPALRWRYQHQKPILQHLHTQRNLLNQASQKSTHNGVIVYATCSILDAENQHVPVGWKVDSEQWIWPHQQAGDGFYWKVLTRDHSSTT